MKEEIENAKRVRPPDLHWDRIITGALLLFVFFVLMKGCAHAQITGADFCQGQNPAKSSVSISITSSGAGEHQLVAPVAGQVIQVCAYVYDLGGTTPTAQFDYGTKTSTDCDTNVVHLQGAMSALSRQMPGPIEYFSVPVGNQLCINLGGTTPTAVGQLTYVQK